MIKKMTMTLLIFIVAMNISAAEINYNFVKIGTNSIDLIEPSSDVVEYSGFDLTGSYDIIDHFYLEGHVSSSTADDDRKMQLATLGIGYREELFKEFWAFNNAVLVMQLDSAAVIFDPINSGRYSQRGHRMMVGMMTKISDRFELKVLVSELDMGEVDDQFGNYDYKYALIGLNAKIVSDYSVYLEYEKELKDDRTKQISFGFRWDY